MSSYHHQGVGYRANLDFSVIYLNSGELILHHIQF